MVNRKNLSVRKIIKMMMLRRDITLSALAQILNNNYGYSLTQSNLSRKLINETVKWHEFQDIASVLGYKIKIEEIPDWHEFLHDKSKL